MSDVMVEPKVKVKKYRGFVADGAGWVELGDVCEAEGVRWTLCAAPEAKHGWRNIKLVARGFVDRKANYWLGWSGAQQRIAVNKDLRALRLHRPEMEEKLISFLQRCAGL